MVDVQDEDEGNLKTYDKIQIDTFNHVLTKLASQNLYIEENKSRPLPYCQAYLQVGKFYARL